MYHGAEHKCINCVEHGLELNVENVMKSSREHKRCGTSFIVCNDREYYFLFVYPGIFSMAEGCGTFAAASGDRRGVL